MLHRGTCVLPPTGAAFGGRQAAVAAQIKLLLPHPPGLPKGCANHFGQSLVTSID